MKNITAILLLLLAATVAKAQHDEKRSLSDFQELAVGQSIELIIERGNTNQARIETRGITTDYVLTEVKSGKLMIGMKKGNFRSKSVKVYLEYSNPLTAIKVSSSASLSGASVVETANLDLSVSSSARATLDIQADNVEIGVSSSGRASLGVQADNLKVAVSSSGRLEIAEGKVSTQRFSVSSSGRYSAFGLQSQRADGSTSSSGSVEVWATDVLDASASSSGRVLYKGNPEKVIIDTRSSGSVRKAG